MYTLTVHTSKVSADQYFYQTKKQALKAMSQIVNNVKNEFTGAGYKKVGSLKSGRLQFEHERYGVDFLVILES